ncbi:phage tail spike protein [Gracilibacillus suaedae]|uniref:phage tail spike protein n=1 Tax=Gracilibacillus suaedae TaxID=2820273 RepID=UPI001ABE7C1F|nr:phage tail spike protein [Gracilibacillus suaedae]
MGFEKTPIYIFDKQDNLLTITDNYIEAPFEEETEKPVALTVTFPAEDEDAKHLIGGNQVAFKDLQGRFRLFVIREEDDEHADTVERTVKCLPCIQELDDVLIEDRRLSDATMAEVLDAILEKSRWKRGNVADLGLQSMNFYYVFGYASLQEASKQFTGEFIDRIEVDDTGIAGRYVDIVASKGVNNGKRFEIGKDITSIRRTKLFYPKTALYGRGSSVESGDGYSRKITFADIEWSTANGDPVDKPLGQEWVGDEEAKQAYGIWNPDTQQMEHRFGHVEFNDETDKEALLQSTYENLQTKKETQAEYEMSIATYYKISGKEHEQVFVGDTGIARDMKIKPIIVIESRVLKLVYDIGDPSTGDVTLGNFLQLDERDQDIEWVVEKVKNNSGMWDESTDPTVDDDNFPYTVPLTPTGLTATGAFKTVQLSWDYDASSYIAGYELYASQTSGFVPDDDTNLVWRGKSGGYVFDANTNEQWYFRLRAFNTHGTRSDLSGEVTAQTLQIDANTDIADQTITRSLLAEEAIIEKVHLNEAIITDAHIDGRLSAGSITVGSDTSYDPNYDPSTKETPSGAQTKADEAYKQALNEALAKTMDKKASMANGAFSKRVVLHSATIRYACFDKSTKIYINGTLQIDSSQDDIFGTFSCDYEDEITSNKPIALIYADKPSPVPSMNLKTKRTGFITDRYSPHRVRVYAEEDGVIEVRQDDPTKATPDYTIDVTAYQRANITIDDDDNGHQYYLTSNIEFIGEKDGNNGSGDCITFFPASKEILIWTSPNEGILDFDGKGFTNHGNGFYSSDGYILAMNTADGAGGDGESAVAWEACSDNYVTPHPVDGYEIRTIEPCTVNTYLWDNNAGKWTLYNTHDLTSASRNNPMDVSVGDDSGSGTQIGSSTAIMKFQADGKFYVRTNDVNNDGEYPPIGYLPSLTNDILSSVDYAEIQANISEKNSKSYTDQRVYHYPNNTFTESDDASAYNPKPSVAVMQVTSGWSGATGSTYGVVTTYWSAEQRARQEYVDADNKVVVREVHPSTYPVWSNWREVEDTEGAQAKANQALNDAKEYRDLWAYPGTTKINGGDIYTNSVTANEIDVSRLSALSADLGDIYAGNIYTDDVVIGNNTVTIDDVGIEILDGNLILKDSVTNMISTAMFKNNLVADHSFESIRAGSQQTGQYVFEAIAPKQQNMVNGWSAVGSPRVMSIYQTGGDKLWIMFGLKQALVNSSNYLRQRIAATGNATFNLSAHFRKHPDYTSATPRLYVQFLDYDYNVLSSHSEDFTAPFNSSTTYRYDTTFTTPSNTSFIELRPRTAGSNWLLIDGVQLVEHDIATPYAPENELSNIIHGLSEPEVITSRSFQATDHFSVTKSGAYGYLAFSRDDPNYWGNWQIDLPYGDFGISKESGGDRYFLIRDSDGSVEIINGVHSSNYIVNGSNNLYLQPKGAVWVSETGYNGGNPDYREVRASDFVTASSVTGKTNIQSFEETFESTATEVIMDQNFHTYYRQSDLDRGIYDKLKIGLLAEESHRAFRDENGINNYSLTSALGVMNQEQELKIRNHDKEFDNVYEILDQLTYEINQLKGA